MSIKPIAEVLGSVFSKTHFQEMLLIKSFWNEILQKSCINENQYNAIQNHCIPINFHNKSTLTIGCNPNFILDFPITRLQQQIKNICGIAVSIKIIKY